MLLLAGYLYALARERWLVATALALLVGLSRPIAVPLGLVTLVVVVMRWRAAPSGRRSGRARCGHGVAALAGCGVAGLLWPAIAWWRTGVSSRLHRHDGRLGGRPATVEPFTPWLDMSPLLLRRHVGPGLARRRAARRHRRHGGRALGARPRRRACARGPWPTRPTWRRSSTRSPASSATLIPLFPLLVVLVGAGWADRRGNTWAAALVASTAGCSCSSSSGSTAGPTSSGASSPRATTPRDGLRFGARVARRDGTACPEGHSVRCAARGTPCGAPPPVRPASAAAPPRRRRLLHRAALLVVVGQVRVAGAEVHGRDAERGEAGDVGPALLGPTPAARAPRRTPWPRAGAGPGRAPSASSVTSTS